MIVHLRQVSTSDGTFWLAEHGGHEIWRRDREQAIATLLLSLGSKFKSHFRDASTLTICVAERGRDHHISCDLGEDCQCGI